MAATGTYQWVETNSPVASSRTDDIWFFDEQTGWLVNSNGQVSKTMDAGNSWEQKFFLAPNLPSHPYLRCMGWANQQIGWFGAVTQGSDTDSYLKVLLHHTTDGGETWNAVNNLPQGSPAGICGFYAVNEKVAYGSGTNDPNLVGPGVIKTVDGGENWELIPMTGQADNLIDIFFLDEHTGWVVGGKTDVSCPTNTPAYQNIPQYQQLKPVVLKTTDGGKTWVNTAAGVQGYACGEWGWKIQFLNDKVGFVSLENFASAAILKTTDGGESWVRLPIVDSSGEVINNNLEGVGFIDESHGWVGGWGDNFEGLNNSFTSNAGSVWTAQNHVKTDPSSDPRIRINRYRFLGQPVTGGYCSGQRVYKLITDAGVALRAAAAVNRVAPADSFALSHVPNLINRAVEISYTLPRDVHKVAIGIWNHFAVHVKTLVVEAQTAGRRTVVWDGTDDNGKPLGGGVYICRMVVDGQQGESQMVRLPD